MRKVQLFMFFISGSATGSISWCQKERAAGRVWRLVAAGLLGLLSLSGCGTLPAPPTRAVEVALPAATTGQLAQIALVSTPETDQSGVRLLPLGAYSLDARLQLATRASRSLDLQYYVFDSDSTGHLLMAALRDAGLRGVRVRLLVDDLYTAKTDDLLRELATFPNVQVRLFNPFCCARHSGVVARYTASIFDFGRLNHRMHNKLFIADSLMAVAGGRNIADEYFLRSSAQNFVDMDAFVMGAVIPELSHIFDGYWNSSVVYPIEAIDGVLADPVAAQASFNARISSAPPMPLMTLAPVDVLGYGPLAEEFESGRLGLVWGNARAFADPPDKLLSKTAQMAYENSVSSDVMMRVWRAQTELVVTSPYLIPGKRGLESFANLRRNNVKVTVVTNSLAATDEPLAHNGYARYRAQMLEDGVDLYELSPTRTRETKRLGLFGSSLGRLHAKTAVIDRKTVFIGSMNLDPRSANENTELGMFIDSPPLAREMLRVINISKLEGAYRVRFRPGAPGLQWLTIDGDHEVILDNEPEVSPWHRLQNMLLGWFVPEQLL